MANRQFQLTEEEVNEVKQYEQQSKRPDELKRLQAIRLYGTGYDLPTILDVVGCGESSVRIWAMQYTQMGIEGVLSHYDKSAQNARKLSLEQENDLCDKLRQYRPIDVLSEAACHGTGDFWTVEDLKQVVTQWYGVTYGHASSYRRLLHRCGFSYQKVEQIYKSRPSAVDVAEFEAELEKK